MSIKRTILATVSIPELPGWESRIVLLEYPPNAAAPLHKHPRAGIDYIVEGEVTSQWEGKEVERYSVGETFIDPADDLHVRSENPSQDMWLRIVMSYVIKKGEPNVVSS